MTPVFSLHLGSIVFLACHARIKTPARPFGESRTLACVGAERLWATAASPSRRCSAYREVRRSAGGGGGFPPPGFLGTLSPQKEFPWGSGGRSAPVTAGGPKARTEEGRRRRPKGVPPETYRSPPARVSLCKGVRRGGAPPFTGGPGAARPRERAARRRPKGAFPKKPPTPTRPRRL